jgi:hypothetical protein
MIDQAFKKAAKERGEFEELGMSRHRIFRKMLDLSCSERKQ